jgi:large subunit ribosomal protein L32
MGSPGGLSFHGYDHGQQTGRQEEDKIMAVPKRKQSRSNTRSRRSQWKAEAPTLVKTVENGRTVYSLPHRAKMVTDSVGTELFLEYKGRKVADA